MSHPFNPSFTHPLPSKATRKPPARSRASSRGLLPGQTPHDPRPRLRYFESKREQDVLYQLLARPDVVDIWDQPPPVEYRAAEGRRKPHTFDFLITLADGRRIAIAVKPAAIVERHGFRETLKRIRAATPLNFADEVVLITEQRYCPSAARNAQKLHDFRRTPDPEADRIIAELTRDMSGPTPIADLVRRSGLGGRAFRAAFRAIFAGILRAVDSGDILPSTRITPEVVQ
ncbi:TnsA endonuclease N-terminal domain-containing protein [Paracoccus saliphilus]|uniref:Tn7 transposase TnsA N-terminal domain-containing protein n=1 Tax=Paracoccus saliphilus TaxID=405559 RepID=A0AA46A704_9RHOB|nr:TnsA endonuclease N-terminal domain-containing protein [Paracoccus saliphilus]WCR03941.1 Tn7 transposase TnsA N-terminal domain-containing protein [Paracoccus saliphilus]SIT06010.1 TnsA endonuclease N terminal [Paracoccus saliphilus]